MCPQTARCVAANGAVAALEKISRIPSDSIDLSASGNLLANWKITMFHRKIIYLYGF
jgi:hypothetical protein